MTGTEMYNRVAGKPEESGPGRTGRPPKPETAADDTEALDRFKLIYDRENPRATSLAVSEENDHVWLKGSILQILFPSGEHKTVVLMTDTRIVPLE
jgi:hypothetical protein